MKISTPLSEYGDFWLLQNDEFIDRAHTARGKLSIDEDGKITLDIDSHNFDWDLISKHDSGLHSLHPKICGYLSRLSRFVYMEDTFVRQPGILRNGHFFPESINAYVCVFSEDFENIEQLRTSVCAITIDLGKNWPWIGFNMGEITEQTGTIQVKYPHLVEKSYRIINGNIAVCVERRVFCDMERRDLSVRQFSSIKLTLDEPISLIDVRHYFSQVEDFLLLLTNQPYRLDWPSVETIGNKNQHNFFCRVNKFTNSEISYFKCWLPFSDIDHIFGKLFDNWLMSRKQYGSAMYLLTSAKRNSNLTVEHRFTNLITGLEALHVRSRKKLKPENIDIQTERILKMTKEIFEEEDQKWLEKQLKRDSQKVSLSVRLKHLLFELPFYMNSEKLDEFIKLCVKIRNDLTHFGGPRPGSDYVQFIVSTDKCASALEQLYHLAILKAIGVPNGHLETIAIRSRVGFEIRFFLEAVGIAIEPAKD